MSITRLISVIILLNELFGQRNILFKERFGNCKQKFADFGICSANT